MDLVLRDVTETDFDWLYDLKTQTMSKYITDSGDLFTRDSQTGRVMKAYHAIKIVRSWTQDIGMLKVERSADSWELIQIQFLPAYQRRGIGTKLIQNLQTGTYRIGIPLYLSVLKVNPARYLYERLGFVIVQENEKSYKMRSL